MRVTSRFLFRVTEIEEGWVAVCPSALLTSGPSSTRDEALSEASVEAREYLETKGPAWVRRFQHIGDIVTCPEGSVRLPIDLWYCKLTKRPCPIQAQVFVTDWPWFDQGCEAAPARRAAIFQTVSSGRYGGAHHVPGRYLCPGCRRQPGRDAHRYHYQWELQRLGDQTLGVESTGSDLRRSLLLADLPLSYTSSAICDRCSIEAVDQLMPDIVDGFVTIDLEMEL